MSLFAKQPTTTPDGLTLTHAFDRKEEHVETLVEGLPAEWAPQSAIQLTWPHAQTDWAYMLPEVTACYLRMAYEIAVREPLLIVSPEPEAVQTLLKEKLPQKAVQNIRLFACPTNDTWARDHGFITLLGSQGPLLLDFQFNGWGQKFEATKDNAINQKLFEAGLLHGTYANHLDFVLEGGSIESDGQGTLLTTTECLTAPHRNPWRSKEDLEPRLKQMLGADRVLWLDHGYLEGDDTDSHVDTLARLCPQNTIVYVQCQDPSDVHYEALHQMEADLRAFRTADGWPYRLLALPMADAEYDEDGQRLPATYANFLIMNGAVLMPTYAQPEHDAKAKAVLQEAFPHHEIVGIDCRPLIRQHGSLHCCTMQFPAGVIRIGEK